MPTIAELAHTFSIPGTVSITAGEGGLPRVEVTNRHASAHIYLHGAHVSHFQTVGHQPLIWMSARSLFAKDKPIRGGVPICWPWFGPHASDASKPAHGFARSLDWTLAETATLHDGRTRVVMTLSSDAATLQMWPHAFVLRYTITIGQTLELDLRVDNLGDQPFVFTEALHTYLTVGDVRQIRISGLSGTTYSDKVRQFQRYTDTGDILFTDETDRVYLKTTTPCTVHDPLLTRKIVVSKTGSQATVIWNPWIAKAKAMADFGDDEWPGMVCVETVNALDHAVTLTPGASHHMTAFIRAEGIS
jgi:glucose-6-phosphate 1-epimerase